MQFQYQKFEKSEKWREMMVMMTREDSPSSTFSTPHVANHLGCCISGLFISRSDLCMSMSSTYGRWQWNDSQFVRYFRYSFRCRRSLRHRFQVCQLHHHFVLFLVFIRHTSCSRLTPLTVCGRRPTQLHPIWLDLLECILQIQLVQTTSKCLSRKSPDHTPSSTLTPISAGWSGTCDRTTMPCGLEPPLLDLDCCGFMVGVKCRHGEGCVLGMRQGGQGYGNDIKIATMERKGWRLTRKCRTRRPYKV